MASTSLTAPIRCLHVIPGLRIGGTESHLSRLLSDWPEPWRHTVVSLLPDVPLAGSFRAAGVSVEVIDAASVTRLRGSITGLLRAVRRADPEVIVGWMYHGNLAALVARRFSVRRPPVVWNIRASLGGALGRASTWSMRLGAWMSRAPAAIVYNAEASRRQHAAAGYDDARAHVVPNGVDTGVFRPSPEARLRLRRELGLPDDATLIGRIGRYHAMKGFPDFARAAAEVLTQRPDVQLILAGPGVDVANRELVALLAETGVAERAHLLGVPTRVAEVLAALDVCVSSSVSTEAFPNVVAEAMSCGVACVATDVGDAAVMLGDAGLVVAPRDPGALARAVLVLLALSDDARARLGQAARIRIERAYSLAAARERFARLWAGLAEVRVG